MTAAKYVLIDLLLITPGAALVLLQEWTPFLLLVAGTAGSALAIAVRNYRAVEQQKARVDRLEPLVSKRATDRPLGYPSARAAFSPQPSQRGQQGSVADLPAEGVVGTDG